MFCKNCGKEITTNICYNCGYDASGFTPTVNAQANTQQNYSQPNYTQQAQPAYTDNGFLTEGSLAAKNGLSAKVTAMDWFKTYGIGMLIALIPFLGGIGSLVYYIVLLCRKSTAESIKGYLKFNLIFSAILTGIMVIFFIFIFVMLMSAVGSATDYVY